MKRARVLVAAAAALVALLVPVVLINESLNHFGALNDFPQYNAAARLVIAGRAPDVYRLPELFAAQQMLHPDLKRGIAVFIPPPGVVLLAPLGWAPAAAAFSLWMAGLVSALAAALLLFKRALSVPWVGVLWLVATLCLFGPAFESFRIGQPAPFMLFALGLFALLARSDRQLLAGAVLSFLLLKPQEAIPVVVLAVGAGKYRVLLGFAAASAFFVFLSLLLFGRVGYENYIQLLLAPGSQDLMQSSLNPTLRGQMLLLFPQDEALVRVVSFGVTVTAYCLCFLLGRLVASSGAWFEAALAGALPLGLATAWHMHDYDLLLLAPAFLVLSRNRTALAARWPLAALALLILPFMMPFYIDLHYGYLLKGATVNPLALCSLAFGFLSYALTYRDFSPTRATRPQAAGTGEKTPG